VRASSSGKPPAGGHLFGHKDFFELLAAGFQFRLITGEVGINGKLEKEGNGVVVLRGSFLLAGLARDHPLGEFENHSCKSFAKSAGEAGAFSIALTAAGISMMCSVSMMPMPRPGETPGTQGDRI